MKRCAQAFSAAIILALAVSAQADNLLSNPSFESTKSDNPTGQPFENWEISVNDPPARVLVSPIAHGGERSCLLIGDVGSKTRVYTPEKAALKPDPGRYRAKVYLRGLDIGLGGWGSSMHFCCGPDAKFFSLKKKGNFGWTSVTHVFDVKAGATPYPFRLWVGLDGGGRLWVDDASVEKVDESVPLTPEPVLGQEEVPIKPTAALSESPVRCPDCQYLNSASGKRCFACGAELVQNVSSHKDLPKEKLVADLENGTIAPFLKGDDAHIKYTTEHVPSGKGGVQVEKTYIALSGQMDWSGYTNLCFDAYNPSESPTAVGLEVSDALSTGYWGRANLTSVIPSGTSTVRICVDTYVGEKARPGRTLMLDKLKGVVIRIPDGTAILSHFRLERIDPAPVMFDGLLAFKFGTIDSPRMAGFTPTTARMLYDPFRGYGWVDATFWRCWNVLQPDPLVQSFVCPTKGAFRVDLPNGKYHVVYCIESPGGYWGEAQTYEARQVTCNGQVVLDEKQDFEKFMARYFRNAHKEDLPGADVFAQYVQTTCPAREFDATVTDGKLEVGFKGESWANSLSYVVVYPESKAPQGKRFMEWVTQTRRDIFNDGYKQVQPKRAAVAPAKGYTVFVRPLDIPINAYDGPAAGEALEADKQVQLSVAGREESALVLAVQPSAEPLGAMDLTISAFVNEKGQKLDPSFFEPGWLDYRISRIEMDGSVYTVTPRYWHPTPAPAAPGVTRCFWIRTHTPAGAAPGKYQGQITIRPANGQPRQVAVTIRVLPFDLDPITDVAVGPIGSSISVSFMGDPKAAAWNAKAFERTLDVIAQSGATTLTGLPTLKAKASKGKIELDAVQADKEMELLRAKGFRMPIIDYGSEAALGYQRYGRGSGADAVAAGDAGFPNVQDYLKALYAAIDKHAAEQHWLPVVWNLCDEPLPGEVLNIATANAQAHRQAAAGLKLTTFGGFTSMSAEEDPKKLHAGLIQALPMPILNLHDQDSINLAKAAGNQWAFYNGATRWTYGRYLKMLVAKNQLAARVAWHFNIVAGDPYYALDCREDDYCWYNTDENQTMVPSMLLLRQILPGLNDYRYLSTLQRLLKEKASSPAAAEAKKVFDEQVNLVPGKNRADPKAGTFEADRQAVTNAIVSLVESK